MMFARHLANKFPYLKATMACRLSLPADLPSAIEIFESMSYGSDPEMWSFCDLKDVFRYLRGGATLQLPAEWKEVIPRSFPEAPATA